VRPAAQARAARSPPADRARDGTVACSSVAQWWQGVAGDLKLVNGKVPGKEERAGAHRNDGSMVRWCKWRQAAAFVGGEGAPVGGDGGCGVLQHRRGKGVRKLQGLVARGGAHRGVADGGSARLESTRKIGQPVAGGGGPGAGSGGEAQALERRSRRGVETGDEWARSRLSGAVISTAEGERKERGGAAVEVPRGAGRLRGARPRPAGGAPTVAGPAATRMRRTRAARRSSDSNVLVLTRQAPVAARAGRHRWRSGARGPAREESGWPSPDEQ
jgi:hypothetical protein